MRFAILAFILCIPACSNSPATGTVTGTITLDGQPVEGTLIRFIPIDGESQPDDSPITAGKYTVTMPPGEKRVEIFWQKTTGTEDTATQGKSKSVQMIPAKYNTQTTLTYTITAGSQTKDFELTTK